ncbi:MAG: hypothetical protein M1817_002534 [Caeruleum heppii]|nr:MAG: hypothetical protein M1817_002534 [Caeruleum heppii]
MPTSKTLSLTDPSNWLELIFQTHDRVPCRFEGNQPGRKLFPVILPSFHYFTQEPPPILHYEQVDLLLAINRRRISQRDLDGWQCLADTRRTYYKLCLQLHMFTNELMDARAYSEILQREHHELMASLRDRLSAFQPLSSSDDTADAAVESDEDIFGSITTLTTIDEDDNNNGLLAPETKPPPTNPHEDIIARLTYLTETFQAAQQAIDKQIARIEACKADRVRVALRFGQMKSMVLKWHVPLLLQGTREVLQRKWERDERRRRAEAGVGAEGSDGVDGEGMNKG